MSNINTLESLTFNLSSVADKIKNGSIGVIATDTIYGLVGSALNADAVGRIYAAKERDPSKPLIILISNINQLKDFGVDVTDELTDMTKKYWPGPYSIVIPVINSDKNEYLTRGKNSLCFRLPSVDSLSRAIDKSGPIVAPSANPESEPPAISISEAYDYFGDSIDFYCDGGVIEGKASTIVEFVAGAEVIHRK